MKTLNDLKKCYVGKQAPHLTDYMIAGFRVYEVVVDSDYIVLFLIASNGFIINSIRLRAYSVTGSDLSVVDYDVDVE